MARYLSSGVSDIIAYYGIRDILPTYGTGGFRYYGTSGSFLVPSGVTQVRVTAVGAGGGGGGQTYFCYENCFRSTAGGGGGGGGYVVATVPVTPGCNCTVTIGALGVNNNGTQGFPCFARVNGCFSDVSGISAGGTTSFGTAVCATGGGPSCDRITFCCCYGPGCDYICIFCGGCGGCYSVSGGATIVVGRCGNMGCAGSISGPNPCQFGGSTLPQAGGASGSPIGGGGTGAWPGTSSADIFNCRSFAGDTLNETDIANKFLNVVRWPGETILSTVRSQSLINGVAPNNPPGCYCVNTFGGACVNFGCCCSNSAAFNRSGLGGGGAGSRVYQCVFCCFYGYGTGFCCYTCGGCIGAFYGGCASSGFLVVEY